MWKYFYEETINVKLKVSKLEFFKIFKSQLKNVIFLMCVYMQICQGAHVIHRTSLPFKIPLQVVLANGQRSMVYEFPYAKFCVPYAMSYYVTSIVYATQYPFSMRPCMFGDTDWIYLSLLSLAPWVVEVNREVLSRQWRDSL